MLALLELVAAADAGLLIQHAHFRPRDTLQRLCQPKAKAAPGRDPAARESRAGRRR